jgi:hypothetical protein
MKVVGKIVPLDMTVSKEKPQFFKFYFQTKANENQQLTVIETTIDSNVFFLHGRYLKRKT